MHVELLVRNELDFQILGFLLLSIFVGVKLYNLVFWLSCCYPNDEHLKFGELFMSFKNSVVFYMIGMQILIKNY